MKVVAKTITPFLLFFFFLFTAPSTAEIQSIKIRSDDRPMIIFEKFGFTHTGNVTVAISAVSVTSMLRQPDLARLGFFLLAQDSLNQVILELQQNPYFCILDSKYILFLFTFRHLSPPPQSSFHISSPVSYPREYSLFFANCNPETLVTMDVRTELYNIKGDGATKTKEYLSVGMTQLPSLYFIFSLLYLCFLGFWITVCSKHQLSVHQVHLLMGVLLTMKALSLFCQAEVNYYVNVTGTAHGWNILFYIFQFINSVLSSTVIVLIGAGWLYLKPLLLGKEKKVLFVVITLQVLANVSLIVISETGPFINDWVTWNQVYLLADVICCCAIIFPIAWSIRSVSKTDEKSMRNLGLFRLFCVLVIGYFLVSRIGIFALRMIVAYNQQWVCAAAKEAASLVFYLVMFYMFRPVGESDYVVVDDEGEYEEAPGMVKG